MPHRFLTDGGEVGRLIAARDWTDTPLGPIEGWPVALRITLSTILSSHQPMRVWWGDALINLYNDAYVAILGPGKHPASLGASAWEAWPELRPLVENAVALARSGRGEPLTTGRFLLNRPGYVEERWYDRTSSPIYDENDELVGILGIGNDATRDVIGHRRQETLARLRIPVALGGRSRDQVVLQVVDALQRAQADLASVVIYQLGAHDGLAHRIGATGPLADELPAAVDPLHDDRLPLGRASLRTHHLAPDSGALTEADTLAMPANGHFIVPLRGAEHDSLVGYLVVTTSPNLVFDSAYRDFLELVAANVATVLSALEARSRFERERETLAAQFTQAPVPMSLLVGDDLVFELANQPYLEMVGRTADIIGKPFRDVFAELPQDAPVFELVWRVYETGEPFTAHEYHVALDRAGDGEVEDAYFSFTCQPLRDLHGRIIGVMTAAVDVTPQVQATRHLEDLARREREARAEAERANRTKDQFLAMLGHELRNPLAPIRTAVRLLQMRGQESRELGIIERQTHHLIRLVDDLLDISRITRGKIELHPQAIDLRACVERSVEMTHPLFEQRRQHLELDLGDEPLTVHADPDRMAQVISNLLNNASRYSELGKTVRVQTQPGHDDTVVLRVRDEGIGISSEMLPRIFGLFQQHAQTLDRSHGGLGLGLAIVERLVELHGGQVTAASEGPGRGAEFTLALPRAEPAADDDTADDDASTLPTAARPLRILVVDDNEDAASLQAELLERLGHHTAVSHDGPGALELAASYQPDVCLLDIGLPVLDGYEVARRLRAARGRGLGLVAVTGYGQVTDRARSAAAGFDAHLVKPIDQHELDALLVRLGSRSPETDT